MNRSQRTTSRREIDQKVSSEAGISRAQLSGGPRCHGKTNRPSRCEPPAVVIAMLLAGEGNRNVAPIDTFDTKIGRRDPAGHTHEIDTQHTTVGKEQENSPDWCAEEIQGGTRYPWGRCRMPCAVQIISRETKDLES